MQDPQHTNSANNFIWILKIKIDFDDQKALLAISEIANSFNKSLYTSIFPVSVSVMADAHHISLYYPN